ncbi:GlxA family transcriptional regulator [Janthinobacterium agaricidamnosum]|uniref:Bacterial regulatory helix-turn-helix s, AraC family protein n=1 Tax=Janthinobacterium agaricidamnosum NBRC 102515 = DSM 9628 TaxID=1349767 RepID=W0V5E1_9BURK|nr:GlxA family transcriptional regulator [Janthinobacterium agaricidamnosum]CDG83101.1 bacterial regulatory helix-turn-helix s, AraC family protein [Janthinobacterium agaricidamnosum NBRC 102515 = DSM 9628]
MKRIGLIVFPEFQLLELAALTPFEMANAASPKPHYTLEVLSVDGGLVKSSMGVEIRTVALADQEFDTLLMAGSTQVLTAPPGLLNKLRSAAPHARRLGSVCTGAFIFAEAGLLDGRHATTHWALARQLQQRFPKIHVTEDRIFTAEGRIWTSAGMTACIDMVLAMVGDDLGLAASRFIARQMVVYHQRPGGQAQFSALLELEPQSDRIHKTLIFIKDNLRNELSVERLAGIANLSKRQFTRQFQMEIGQPPAQAVERIRVESARMLLESGGHSIERVADSTGFGDPERMRRAFRRIFDQPPQHFKRKGQHGVPSPAS